MKMFPIPNFDSSLFSLIFFIVLCAALTLLISLIPALIISSIKSLNNGNLKSATKKVRTIICLPFILIAALYGDYVYDSINSYIHETQEAKPQIASQKYTLLENISDGFDIYNKVSTTPLRFYLEDSGDKSGIKIAEVSASKFVSTSDLDVMKEGSVDADHDSFNGIKIEEEITHEKDSIEKHWKVWNRSKSPFCVTRPEISCENSNLAHVIKPGKYGEF